MTALDLAALRADFRARYARDPRLFYAPGRVNLIGEHTDYNDGSVLPLAIDRGTVVAGAARDDRRLRVYASDLDHSAELDLDAPPPAAPSGTWTDYAFGIAHVLESRGLRLRGADLCIRSDLPRGAGLSSSAALEVAMGLALCSLSAQPCDPVALALAAQAAERQFAGTQCGIMDPLVATTARAEHALLLDCRSLARSYVPLDAQRVSVVICDSGVRHALAASAYNERRAECAQTSRLLGLASLRDLAPAGLAAACAQLPAALAKRCCHVVSENARTALAAEHLQAGELAAVGRLLSASHASLRDDYAVSCNELDSLVELASGVPGVFGAKMTGGGFGGSVVALAAPDAVPALHEALTHGFHARHGYAPVIVTTRASGCARELHAS